MGYSKEELFENLPDFIENKITEVNLKTAIEEEISSNPDFKTEFESLLSMMKSVKEIEFQEPPVNYFSTLLPRINEKLNNEPEKISLHIWFSRLWKYAVPVAAVIIFFISYKAIFISNDYIEQFNNDSQIVINELNYSDEKITDTSENSHASTESSERKEEISEIASSKSNVKQTNTKINLQEKEDVISSFLNYNDNTQEEDDLFTDEYDIFLETNFDKMSKEEQNNLISKIKNSNL